MVHSKLYLIGFRLLVFGLLIGATQICLSQPEGVFVEENGNVGIGIENPSSKLHVFGGGLFKGNAGGLGVNPGSDYVALSYASASGSYSNMYMKWAKTYFNGNVGIGTSNPQQLLHVDDRIRVGQDPTYGTVYGELIHEGGGTGFRLNAHAGGGTWADLHFQTNGTTKMFLESAGKLGVGTISPLAKLHIEGGVDASNTTHGYFMAGPVTSTNIIIDNNEIMARNNGASSFLYLNNNGGTVHLGPGSPAIGYQLSVSGKIMAEELRIDNYADWPDYVFEEGYSLPTLDQLKIAIQENGHLPGIPTAEDVSEEGFLVGEMQGKMLEKIEELTLYILQLHEENKALKKDIKELKSAFEDSTGLVNQSQNQ
jgi:hypothetical protein